MDERRFNIFALCFSALVILAIAVKGEPQQERYEPFLRALAQKESGGDPYAFGDLRVREILGIPIPLPQAIGQYQLWPAYVDDVNIILGRSEFTYADRWDPGKSALMVVIYLDYYATPKRLGHKPTWFDRARIHNGGPCGFKKSSTVGYGKDVMQIMRELRGQEWQRLSSATGISIGGCVGPFSAVE